MYRVGRGPDGSHAVERAADYLPLDVGASDSMLGTWSEHVDQLLDEGERERHRVDLERATVVVTNRRVMAFTPDEEGANYRVVERPNVARVSVETDSAPGRLVWATLSVLFGTGLLLLATATDLAGLAEGAAGSTGDPTGVADAALAALATALTVFDLSILAASGLLLVVGTALFVSYARSRSQRLVLRVSGGDDVALPVTDADLEAGRAVALQEAIRPDADDDTGDVDVATDDTAAEGATVEDAADPTREEGTASDGHPVADPDESG